MKIFNKPYIKWLRRINSHKVLGDTRPQISCQYTEAGTQPEYHAFLGGKSFKIPMQAGTLNRTDDFNGFTPELLIAIAVDRLNNFQKDAASKLRCKENELAINDLKRAAAVLNQRTQKRIARGVEGTTEK